MSISTRLSRSGGKSLATVMAQSKRVPSHSSVKSNRVGPHSAGKFVVVVFYTFYHELNLFLTKGCISYAKPS